MKLRKAKIKDINVVYKMINSLEDCEFDFKKFKKIYFYNLKSTNIYYFIYEDGQETIAFISFTIQKLLHHAGKVGEITEFFVKNEYRSKGTGTEIIKEIINFAKEKKCKTIELSSSNKREKAHSFYERQGFIKTHVKFVMAI